MKLSISALALMVFVACAPSKYTMHLETRYPSKSGLDLAGKNVSVIYLENGTEFKDGFSASMAESLAYNLEKDYDGLKHRIFGAMQRADIDGFGLDGKVPYKDIGSDKKEK